MISLQIVRESQRGPYDPTTTMILDRFQLNTLVAKVRLSSIRIV